MNTTDKKAMERDYIGAWEAVHGSFEQYVTRIQDDAYEMGYERGCGNHNAMVLALENAACQLLSDGHNDQSAAIDKLLDEVTQ